MEASDEDLRRDRCIKLAIIAVATHFGVDPTPLLEHAIETRREIRFLEPLNVKVGLLCGYKGELPVIEDVDAIDRPCIVVMVAKDEGTAWIAGLAPPEMIRANAVPLNGGECGKASA